MQANKPDRPAASLLPLKALLVAAIVVPALLFAVATWQSRQAALRKAEAEVQHQAAVLREHALKVFETHELIIYQIDERVRGMSWDEITGSRDLNEYLRRLDTSYDQVNALALIDPNGMLRANSNVFPIESPTPSATDRDYYQAHKAAGGQTFIGEVITRRASGGVAFNVSRRRGNPDETFDGLVLVSVNQQYFTDFWATATPPRRQVISIVREDGAVLVRYPPTPDQARELAPEARLMQEIGKATQGAYTAPSSADEVERINGWSKIGNYPLYIRFGVPKSAALQEWRNEVLIYAGFAVPAALGLFFVTLIALRRSMREQAAARRLETEAGRRRQAEQSLVHKDTLFREVNHRVKNNLQVITGFLQLQSRRFTDRSVVESFAGCIGRIQTISGIHELLYRQESAEQVEFGGYLRLLCGRMADALDEGQRIKIDVDAEPVELSLDIAVSLALMVNEIVTNSAKHAFPGQLEGRIYVAFSRLGKMARLDIGDDGVGIQAPPRPHSLGLELIEVLSRQIDGALERPAMSRGTHYRITFPIGSDRQP